ncbi:MAG: murein biosynthesis integral membrane protein MurJ [Oscillospiraceae bacterium]|nr:murein biosynthesis integral membrane protein MurJ [Oscillospiraceae bacterium]
MQEEQKKPVRAVSLMIVITLAGKILGLVRDRLLTINYGSGMEANAFLTASRIPRVFFDTVFASAISASLIPVFSELLRKKGKHEAMCFAGNFFSVMGLLCALLTALGMLFAGELTAFFADGYDAETAALAAQLTRIMMPTVLFTGVAFSFVGILQSLDEFNIPAAISLFSNCAVILYYLTLNRRFGIFGLAVAFLFAWFLQAAVQLPALRRKGFFYRPSLSLRSDGMRKVFALMLPVMVSTWVLPINQTVNSKFGSRLFGGAGVSAVELAYNLFTVIAGVFVLSVTNYIFPRLSRASADGDRDGLRKTVSGTMHSTMFLVLPMTAGLVVMAEPLVDFLYGGGAFDAFSVGITSRALRYMSLGMIGYAGQAVLCRVFFAEQRGGIPLVAGAASIAVNIALCMALTARFDVAGIAISSAVSFAVNALCMALPLQRRGLGVWDRRFALDMGKMLLATVVMALAAGGTLHVLPDGSGKLLRLLLPIAVGCAVYFAAVLLLRLPEARTAAQAAGNMIRRRD